MSRLRTRLPWVVLAVGCWALTGCQLTEVPDQEAFACAIEPCPKPQLDAGIDSDSGGEGADGADQTDTAGSPDAADTTGRPVDAGPSPDAHPILPDGCEFDGEVGCRCDEDFSCSEGVCATARNGQGFCARSCVNSCTDDGPSPGRLTCRMVERASAFFCVDSWLDVGTPCRAGDDCLCAELPDDAGSEGAAFCTVSCADGAACPPGFSCRAGVPRLTGGEDLEACVPDDVSAITTCPAALSAGFLTLPASSTCTQSDAGTTCGGDVNCADDGSWTACDAPAPVSGTCPGA